MPYGMGAGGQMQALVAANPYLAQALMPVLAARQQALSAIIQPKAPVVHAPPSRIFIGSVSLVYVCVCACACRRAGSR